MERTGFPAHGTIACSRCFKTQDRVQQLGRWRVVNDPGAWGSANPRILVLGFSKGFTQANAYTSGRFDDVPFKGMRTRLTEALRVLGLVPAGQSVDRLMKADEPDFAFGSLVRCSLSRRQEERESATETYSCTGQVMPLAFREEVAPIVRTCSERFLGTLPSRLRLVLMLGTTDSYIKACRNLIRSLAPHDFDWLNDVAYTSRGVVFCHISHPSPLNGHHNNWLNSDPNTKSGRKRESALAAIRRAGTGGN